ncbi:carbon monoxide dehydrogenase subunit G [Sporosarcina soli]|uniref:Carbon monoxide dehydrogenase subunit G n=1 Tax=Sporosarcina soli TaxID=334736 RepID=A0ABW0TGM5_9BACL
MQIAGEAKFDLSKQELWEILHDPEILKNVIPGCEELNLLGADEYEVVMNLGVAAVKGKYTGHIVINNVQEPVHYTLEAEGSGGPGHVKAKMDCKIEDSSSGGVVLKWQCDAEVGGLIAGVGSRVLSGIAKYMAGKFFSDIKKQIKNKV